MKNSKYTKEILEIAVKNPKTLSDVVRKVTNSNSVHGSMIAHIKTKLVNYGIDFSHFIGKGWVNHQENPRSQTLNRESFIENYLTELPKKRTASANLRQYLFKFGLKENKCDECGITNTWNNKPIVNQLDHIDGNRTNNELSNLRILCPNCHSQTETFSGKLIKL